MYGTLMDILPMKKVKYIIKLISLLNFICLSNAVGISYMKVLKGNICMQNLKYKFRNIIKILKNNSEYVSLYSYYLFNQYTRVSLKFLLYGAMALIRFTNS